jgi:hypothetical protein
VLGTVDVSPKGAQYFSKSGFKRSSQKNILNSENLNSENSEGYFEEYVVTVSVSTTQWCS